MLRPVRVVARTRRSDYGITPAGLIVNRVHPGVEPAPGVTAQTIAPLLPEGFAPEDMFARMQQAASDQAALARRDREGVRRLREHIGADMGYTEVPALERDVHDLSALAEVSEHLLGPLPG